MRRPWRRAPSWPPWLHPVLLLALLAAAGCAARPDLPVSARAAERPSAMPAAQGVAGRVVDGAGRPVAGALIEARSLERPPRPLVELGVLSGADGRFRWPLPAGTRAALRARLNDAVSCERDVAAAGGAAEVVLTLPAPAGGCTPWP